MQRVASGPPAVERVASGPPAVELVAFGPPAVAALELLAEWLVAGMLAVVRLAGHRPESPAEQVGRAVAAAWLRTVPAGSRKVAAPVRKRWLDMVDMQLVGMACGPDAGWCPQ